MSEALFPALLPTLPGKVRGIVGWEPLRLQCGDCGTIHEQCSRSVAACIITAGFQFHTCEAGAPRRCPECLVRALTDCGSRRCADALEDARSRAARNGATP